LNFPRKEIQYTQNIFKKKKKAAKEILEDAVEDPPKRNG